MNDVVTAKGTQTYMTGCWLAADYCSQDEYVVLAFRDKNDELRTIEVPAENVQLAH